MARTTKMPCPVLGGSLLMRQLNCLGAMRTGDPMAAHCKLTCTALMQAMHIIVFSTVLGLHSPSGPHAVLQPTICMYWCRRLLHGLAPITAGQDRLHEMQPCALLGAPIIRPPVTCLALQQLPQPLHQLVQTHLPVVVAARCRQVLGSPAPLTGTGGHWRALQLQQPHSLPQPGGAGRTGCPASGRGLQARLSGPRPAGRRLRA